MDAQSTDIYAKKKEALARGDEEVVKQVGQGKDIMSVLREYSQSFDRCTDFMMLVRSTVRANMVANEKDKMSEEEVIGQMT